MNILKRSTEGPIELRAADGKPDASLVGYAAKFGTEYQLYPKVFETIAPGAFARTLKDKPDVRALYNHDTSALLARTASGTLALQEDETGLRFELGLPDTQTGRDVKALVSRGDLTGCSFGFVVKGEKIEDRADGTTLRTLLDVELHEITVCAFPAYEDTEVSLRSVRKWRLDEAHRAEFEHKSRWLDI